MTLDAPETVYTETAQVACDGGPNPALGHPKVYYTIEAKGFVVCGYCGRCFILKGGPADQSDSEAA
ncbi:MAG: zinc-finger domain-containing protein [Rhodothalassiaceae bacterium]